MCVVERVCSKHEGHFVIVYVFLADRCFSGVVVEVNTSLAVCAVCICLPAMIIWLEQMPVSHPSSKQGKLM